MLNLETGFIELEDGQLYYETAGSGSPVVLVHAGFVDSRMWDDTFPVLARHRRVIRFDMQGYGRSSPAQGPVSRTQELSVLLRGLGIERAALLGCSMGGTTVIDFTLEYPERVSALIAVSADPSGFQMQGSPPRYLMDMIAATQAGDLKRTSDLQIRIWVDGSFREPGQVDAQVRRRAAEMNRIPVERGTWAIADRQPLDPLDPPAVGRLGEIHVPTLIVAGALDDPEILRAADLMEKGIRGARKVLLSDSAHVPSMERPAEFTQLVINFLEETEL